MATQPNTEAKTPAPKTVRDDMPARRVFANTTEAAAYLALCAETYADWGDDSIPFAAPGIDSEGNFDPAVYTSEMDVMVAKLINAKALKAVVVAPIPKLETVLADESARQWLIDKVLRKELNHVAVRQLREAEDVSTVIDQMPTTLTGYIESGRSGGGQMEAFNVLYKPVNATMSAKLPVWAKYRLIKSELKKAMESKAYADTIYAALEDYRGQSLFVAAINLAISAAKRKGIDPTIFERWLATRDQKVYDPAQAEDEDELDLDNLTDALLDSEAEDTAPTDEPTA
jgi:hypothetical protein